jgi:uncharacterized protein YfcZ (UPF0381/DUF406 family)
MPKYVFSTTIKADTEEEAIAELASNISEASEKHQISDNNPPDAEWLLSAGIAVKEPTAAKTVWRLTCTCWDIVTSLYDEPDESECKEFYATKELAQKALRLAFISAADDVQGNFSILNKEKTNVDAQADDDYDVAEVTLNDKEGRVMFIDNTGFDLKIEETTPKAAKKLPKTKIGSDVCGYFISGNTEKIEKGFAKEISTEELFGD